MWVILLVVLFVLYWWWSSRRVETMKVVDILGDIQQKRPELYPINTLYMDTDGKARFMMLNTNTYAGELYDYFPQKK